MLTKLQDRQRLIAQVLAPNPDVKADAVAIASRTLWSWERMAAHLTPLIGEAGFHSLYFRALHLTQSECPSLRVVRSSTVRTEDLFKNLGEALRTLDSEMSGHCSSLLLIKFTELISSMIGEVLTGQILRSAWGESLAQVRGQEKPT